MNLPGKPMPHLAPWKHIFGYIAKIDLQISGLEDAFKSIPNVRR